MQRQENPTELSCLWIKVVRVSCIAAACCERQIMWLKHLVIVVLYDFWTVMLYISVDMEGLLVGKKRTRLSGKVVLALLGNFSKTGIGKQFFFFSWKKYPGVLSSLEIQNFVKKTNPNPKKAKPKNPKMKPKPKQPNKMIPQNSCQCFLGLCKAYWAASAQLLKLQLMLIVSSLVGEGFMLTVKLSCQLGHFFPEVVLMPIMDLMWR